MEHRRWIRCWSERPLLRLCGCDRCCGSWECHMIRKNWITWGLRKVIVTHTRGNIPRWYPFKLLCLTKTWTGCKNGPVTGYSARVLRIWAWWVHVSIPSLLLPISGCAVLNSKCFQNLCVHYIVLLPVVIPMTVSWNNTTGLPVPDLNNHGG